VVHQAGNSQTLLNPTFCIDLLHVAEVAADQKIPAWAPQVGGVETQVLVENNLRSLRIFSYNWQADSAINAYNAILSETLNLINGTRSVKEIRDAVSAEYDPVPLDVVQELMDAMAKDQLVVIQNRNGRR
jgi:hypothetical protein